MQKLRRFAGPRNFSDRERSRNVQGERLGRLDISVVAAGIGLRVEAAPDLLSNLPADGVRANRRQTGEPVADYAGTSRYNDYPFGLIRATWREEESRELSRTQAGQNTEFKRTHTNAALRDCRHNSVARPQPFVLEAPRGDDEYHQFGTASPGGRFANRLRQPPQFTPSQRRIDRECRIPHADNGMAGGRRPCSGGSGWPSCRVQFKLWRLWRLLRQYRLLRFWQEAGPLRPPVLQEETRRLRLRIFLRKRSEVQ